MNSIDLEWLDKLVVDGVDSCRQAGSFSWNRQSPTFGHRHLPLMPNFSKHLVYDFQ